MREAAPHVRKPTYGRARQAETVLRSLGDGLCVVDQNWNILLLNLEGQRLCACTEAEVVGRPLPAIISLSSGTSLTEPIFTQILLEETAQGDTFRTDDGLLTTTAGHAFPVSYVLAPIVREKCRRCRARLS